MRRVDFEELAPALETYLGQAAYLQLGYFETLSELIAPIPDLRTKETLSLASGAALTKHRALLDLIRAQGDDPMALMLPFREPLDAFRRATHGKRPLETMLSVYLTSGMLDDFYLALSASYGDTGKRVAEILGEKEDRRGIADIVIDAIADDEEWRSLLALWGRRVVGDTLLIARAVLLVPTWGADEEKRVEPVYTDLMAAHSRRMSRMGLDA